MHHIGDPDDPKYLGGISHPRDNISDYKWQPDVATETMAKSQKANPIKEYRNVDRRELSGGAGVIGLGFEPRTDSLEGYCSIQLSYPTNPLEGCGLLCPTA